MREYLHGAARRRPDADRWPDERALKLLLVVDEQRPEIERDEEDVVAIRRARASIRAGRKIPMDRLMKLLPT